MIERIYNYMTDHNMVGEGSRVLAAVSGGADSMCLLEVLRELRDRAGLQIAVLHVHHGLRESADGDLLYVAEYCKDAGIPFEAVHVDAAGYAAGSGLSVEEAARKLRYEALEQAAERWDRDFPSPVQEGCRIAVAHHIEDQAETVLFNLVRGSRLTGLRGMLPVNGRIIRPLLSYSRGEIEEFLRARGISWREDETNEDIRYSRNLIRKEVMPLLEQINKSAGEHIARAAEEAAETEEFLREQTERAAGKCVSRGEYFVSVSVPELLRQTPLIRRRVIYCVIADVAGRCRQCCGWRRRTETGGWTCSEECVWRRCTKSFSSAQADSRTPPERQQYPRAGGRWTPENTAAECLILTGICLPCPESSIRNGSIMIK